MGRGFPSRAFLWRKFLDKKYHEACFLSRKLPPLGAAITGVLGEKIFPVVTCEGGPPQSDNTRPRRRGECRREGWGFFKKCRHFRLDGKGLGSYLLLAWPVLVVFSDVRPPARRGVPGVWRRRLGIPRTPTPWWYGFLLRKHTCGRIRDIRR